MSLKSSKLFSEDRLLSLDFFRGITMFLLVAEGTHLWSVLIQPPVNGTIFESFFLQFHHHPWNGLRFWDLIQPFFMFIVGVAMPFSYAKRKKRGDSTATITRHIIKRCIRLLFNALQMVNSSYCFAGLVAANRNSLPNFSA
jgi:predicted acyltransferase